MERKDYELQPEDIRVMSKCPCCGRLNAFRRYAHIETQEILNDFIGKCTAKECGHSKNISTFIKHSKQDNNEQSKENAAGIQQR